MYLSYLDRKYWKPINVSGLDGAISKDGLLYMFDEDDIIEALEYEFPYKDRQGWFFNSTKDRYCAQWTGNRITVNPAALDQMGLTNG